MTEQTDNFGIALYYPFINVQDIDWLKGALLYWDAIRCIAPGEDYFDGDIKYLSDEGAIVATDPKSYSTDASVIFAQKMQKYCHNQSKLDIKVINYLKEKFPDLKDVQIHRAKFSEQVFRELGLKVVLGHFDENGFSRFYSAQPYIAVLYLTVLAGEMSKKINAPMLTDIPGLSGLGQHILWSKEIVPSGTEPENFLTQLDIYFPSQEELAKLPFDDILRFRQRRNDERRNFRKAVEDIRSKAQGMEDSNALVDYLNDRKQDIQQAIDDHQKSLRDIGVKSFTSSIKATWPSLFGIPVGVKAGGAVGLLSAIGLAGISIACSKTAISQEYRKTIKDCPWHYLINLEREL